ncbi:amino acid adenylation domain-containing protein [Catenulispora yoronensis]
MVASEVVGPLDGDLLRQALGRLGQRFPALCTVFTGDGDTDGNTDGDTDGNGDSGSEPRSRVVAGWQPTLLEQQLPASAADPVEVAEELLLPAAAVLLRPFERPPVVFVLCHVGPELAVLTLLAHQAVVGVRETTRLWDELVAEYRGLTTSDPADEAAAVPESASVTAAATADLLAERVQHLAAWPGVVELPSDLTRPATQTFVAARLPFAPSPELYAGCAELAQRVDVPLDTVLLAGWALTVGRRAGVGRLLVETQPADGTGLVACELAPDATVAEYLENTARAMAEARRYNGIAFDDLADALDAVGDADANADVNAVRRRLVQFAFETVGEPRVVHAGPTRFEIRPARLGGIDGDAVLRAHDQGRTLELEYAASVLSPQEAADLIGSFTQALSDLIADPRGALADITTVTAEQAERVAAVEHGPDVDSTDGLWQLIEQAAAEHSDAIALRDEHRTLTYAEFVAAAEDLSADLAAVGVREGDRVAVTVRRSAEQIVAVAALIRIGAAYVGIETDMPPAAAALILDTAEVRVIVGDADRVAVLGEAASGRIVLAPAGTSAAQGARDARDAHDAPKAPAPAAPDPARTAYLTFTSGTTGRPKGAVIPCRAVVRLSRRATWLRPGATARFLRIAPMAFDAFTLEVFPVLLAGGTLEIFPEGHIAVDALTAFLADRAVTGLYLSSGLFRLVADFQPEAFTSAVQVLTGGEVVPTAQVRQVLRACPSLTITNGFGHSENTSFTVVHHVGDPAEAGAALPVGRPIDGTGVLVLDDSARPVPPGAVGELYAYGDGLADGYAGLPEETASSFGDFGRPDGRRLYRTGDLVRWGGDGFLRYVGRRDRQVKIRGFRVEPDHVAGILRAHPAVRDAAVAVVPGEHGDKVLLAAVVPFHGDALPPDLRTFAALHLPGYSRPKQWAAVEEFPVTRNGKLDVDRLAALAGPFPEPPAEENPDSRDHSDRPEDTPADTRADTPVDTADDSLTRAIADAWEQVLGHRDFRGSDWFFDVGGDSLRLIRVQAILSRTLPDWNITISDLYSYPAIDDLVTVLCADDADYADDADDADDTDTATAANLATAAPNTAAPNTAPKEATTHAPA